MEWNAVVKGNVPEEVILNTKIDDGNGVRNEQQLIKSRNLWWDTKKSMYMYYTPTHWSY